MKVRKAYKVTFSLMVFALVISVIGASCSSPTATPSPATTPQTTTASPSASTSAKPAASPSPTASATAKPDAKALTHLQLIGGTSGSLSNIWFMALASLVDRYSSKIRIDVVPSKGAADATVQMFQGNGHMAMSTGDLIGRAQLGKNEFQTIGARSDARFLYSTVLSCTHAVVLAGSPIKTFSSADLKGKKIATMEVGSSGLPLVLGLIKAIGLDPQKDVKLSFMTQEQGVDAVRTGAADMLLIGTGTPDVTLQESFASKPQRMIPIPAEAVKKLAETEKGEFPVLIPAGTYKGQDTAAPSSTHLSLLFALERLDPALVYEFTRIWWDKADERNIIHESIRVNSTVERLKEIQSYLPMPIHEGALKYYREKGWLK